MLSNNRGQVFIESILILPVCLLGFIYIIYVLLFFTVEIAIDDALESRLICEIQSKASCQHQLARHLQYLPITEINLQFNQIGSKGTVTFDGRVLHFFQIKKARSLNYETRI